MEMRGIDIQVMHPKIEANGRSSPPVAASPVTMSDGSPERSAAVSPEEVLAAVDKANQFAAASGARLNFSIDDQTHQVIVKVIDEASGEVIRQIPPEEMVRIGDHVRQLMGVLFNRYA